MPPRSKLLRIAVRISATISLSSGLLCAISLVTPVAAGTVRDDYNSTGRQVYRVGRGLAATHGLLVWERFDEQFLGPIEEDDSLCSAGTSSWHGVFGERVGAVGFSPGGLGFSYWPGGLMQHGQSSAGWSFPLWFVSMLAAGWPVALHYWDRVRESRAKARSGLCRTCRYDLRATRDRCPECGTVTALATGATS